MKKLLWIRFAVLLMVFTVNTVLFAQEEKGASYFSNTTDETFNTGVLVQETQVADLARQQNTTISTIYLKQVGYNNAIDIDSNSGSSQSVVQFGQDNKYTFKDKATSVQVNFGVNQLGDANTLSIKGTNQSLDNTRFYQYGGAKLKVNYYKY